MKDALLSIVIAEAFLCGVVYGFGMALMMRRHSPTVRRYAAKCDGGNEGVNMGKPYLRTEAMIDKYLEDLTSDRSADA